MASKSILKVELAEPANILNKKDRMSEITVILKFGLEQLDRLGFLLTEMRKTEESTGSCETIKTCI